MAPIRAPYWASRGWHICGTICVAKQPKTVALVDDDPGIRDALRSLLKAFAFNVELYSSAEEFVSGLPKSKAVALLLDIYLGDLTGIELSRQLQADGVKIPTIFLTGSRDPALRHRALELGCVAFLEKPVQARQLIEAVATATGSNPFFEK
jgi:FixJ family two-component response regulator